VRSILGRSLTHPKNTLTSIQDTSCGVLRLLANREGREEAYTSAEELREAVAAGDETGLYLGTE
jgi:hypothetical protein